MTGPMARPTPIRGRRGTVRAGGRRGGGPRTPSRPRRARRRSPRRVARRISPNQAKPLGLEGLVLSTHTNHKLVNASDSLGNSGSVPETVQVPATHVGGPRVRGLPDAQSPEAVPSRPTGPHRGSQRRTGVSAQSGGRQASPLRIPGTCSQTEADNVGSPPRRSPAPRRGRPRGRSSALTVLRQRVDGRVSEPADDAHRDPLPWTSAGPISSGTIITLVGAGVDQVGETALNGPPRAGRYRHHRPPHPNNQ